MKLASALKQQVAVVEHAFLSHITRDYTAYTTRRTEEKIAKANRLDSLSLKGGSARTIAGPIHDGGHSETSQ